MTDATPEPTAEPAATPAESTAPADPPGANAEAAKYRRQLRDAEAERDQLAAKVERLQRAEVSRLVANKLAVPEDLLSFGVSLADLLGEDGEVEPALVETALHGLLSARPGLAKLRPLISFGQGSYPAPNTAGPSWHGLLRGEES